jgi:hypothetical protein
MASTQPGPVHWGQEVRCHGGDQPRFGILYGPERGSGRDQAALDGNDPADRPGRRYLQEGEDRLTAELDGVKKEGVPLSLDLEQLEDAKTSAGARAQMKEVLRLYFRKVLGR